MVITWDGVIELLKVIPGFVLFPFAVYFTYKKIGYRVGCQLTISLSRVRDTQISSIILQNHKDRPLAIIEIFGIQDNVKFEIEKPDVPFMLKSLETIVVKPAHYSKYICNDKPFVVNAGAANKLHIFIVTPQKTVECEHIYRPTKEFAKYSNGLINAHKIVSSFNDVVYGDNSAFAIVYSSEKADKTSIVSKNGLIDDSDHLGCNAIPKGNLNPESIKSYIKMKTGLDVVAFELDHD